MDTLRRAGMAMVLLLPLVATATAGDEPLAWEGTEVASVQGRRLTWNDLCEAALDHLGPHLAVAESAPSALLRQLVDDIAMEREFARRDLALPAGALEDRLRLEEEVRQRSGGHQGIEDTLAEHVVPQRVFRAKLLSALRREQLVAQGVDVKALGRRAEVRLARESHWGPAAHDMETGVALKVSDRAVSARDVGEWLLAGLGATRVRDLLDAVCRAELSVGLGARLGTEGMLEELEHLRALEPLESRFDPEPVWETAFVVGGKQHHVRQTATELLQSLFARSLFGVMRHFRETATPESVHTAWLRERDTVYGAHVQATDIAIVFESSGEQVFSPTDRPTRKEALTRIRRLALELSRHGDFDEICRRLEAQGDSNVTVTKLRLYPTGRDHLLYEHTLELEDGEVGRPFETLAEVHLLRREGYAAAPSFPEIAPLVRERYARRRAREWLDDNMADPQVVRLRWPLPLLP